MSELRRAIEIIEEDMVKRFGAAGFIRTEICTSVAALYGPSTADWPHDVVRDMGRALRQWRDRNANRRPVTITTMCVDEGGGPVCIVMVHHVAADQVEAAPAVAAAAGA